MFCFTPSYGKDIVIESNISINQKDLNKIYMKYIDKTYPEKVRPYKKVQEVIAWKELKKTITYEDLRLFIEEYPNGKFIKEAKRFLEDYKSFFHNGYQYLPIKSPYTGKIWLDRNLGAKTVCQNKKNKQCYGDHYQFMGEGIDICPSGFKIPNINELRNENIDFLKLPLAGKRFYSNHKLGYVDQYAYIWSSSIKQTGKGRNNPWHLSVQHNNYVTFDVYDKNGGLSVRCIGI